MPKCIVHAGMHDTGAALIQQALHSLNTETHYYAQLAETPNHSAALRTMFVAEPEAGKYAEAMPGKAIAARQKLKAEIAAAGDRTLVLSAEALPQFPDGALEALRDFLIEHHAEPAVAAYVADPVSLMNGMMRRRLMTGNQEAASAMGVYPNYKRKFMRIDSVFGRGNVTLWKFDPAADIVQDFCRRCDIPLTGAVAGPAPAQLARPAALLLFRLAQLRQRRPAAAEERPAEKHLRLALSRLEGAPLGLSPAVLQPVLESKAADIVWMESRLGEPLAMEPGEEGPGGIRSEADLRLTRPEIKGLVRQLRASADPPGEAGRKRMMRLFAEVLDGAQPQDSAAWKGAIDAAPAPAPAAGPAAKKASKSKQAKRSAPAAPPSVYSADSKQARPPRGTQPVLQAPLPLLNKDKRLIVLWSPKSACTTAYVWFSHFSGFSDEVRRYAAWPHRHRIEQFQRSPFFAESAKMDHADFRVLRIIRDPYSRAVSIYRHALHTQFAIAPMRNWSKGKIDAENGYSFQTFLDLVAHLDLKKADIHFRPQFHAYEAQHKPGKIINISKQDLVTELGLFEEQLGFAKTNFEDLNWLHNLESKRKAKQEPLEGDALDTVPFTRHQVHELNHFPSYGQLLTPKAKKKIETLYEVDFNAYADHL